MMGFEFLQANESYKFIIL